jgi:RimJ/RimL family protein N-acetyltransferase
MLTEVDQHQYFKNVVQPSFSAERPSLMLFSYLEGEKCIGYGGLTNIDWEARRAELSFLLDTALSRNTPAYEEAFRMYLSLVKQVAFEDLMFNRIFTETFDVRPHHVRVLEQCGFRREGVMKQHAVVNGHFVDSIIHGYLREYYDAERSAGIC